MKPETQQYLQVAERFLGKAKAILAINLPDEAGRAAYLVAFHAAQALIYERTSHESKTHRGVRSQFLLLTKNEDRMPTDLRRFLGDAYELKSVADYGIDPDVTVSPEEASRALADAARFLACVRELLREEAPDVDPS